MQTKAAGVEKKKNAMIMMAGGGTAREIRTHLRQWTTATQRNTTFGGAISGSVALTLVNPGLQQTGAASGSPWPLLSPLRKIGGLFVECDLL